jgi:hypothetical protein
MNCLSSLHGRSHLPTSDSVKGLKEFFHQDMQCLQLRGMLGPKNVPFSLYLLPFQIYHSYAKCLF